MQAENHSLLVIGHALTVDVIGLVRTLVGGMQKHRSDGVRVGVVIRSVELYVQGKTAF